MTTTPADARATLRREVETAAKTPSSALKILDRWPQGRGGGDPRNSAKGAAGQRLVVGEARGGRAR